MGFFPKTVCVELTEKAVREFIKENVDGFLDFVFLAYPYAADGYCDDNSDELLEFVVAGGAG